ncbi:MAG: hypothetical protein ACREMA_16895 [Longimicrobiales bacterium]
MTKFEFLSVLISIVLGLGMTQLLSNLHRLVQARQRVRLYWLPLAWAALIFVSQVEWWWAMIDVEETAETWTFFYFLFMLLSPVVLYLAAAFALPTVEAGHSYDLRAYYYDTRQWFFGALALQVTFDAIRRAIQAGTVADFGALSNAVTAVVLGVLTVTRREWYHALVTFAVSALFLVFLISEL